MEFFVVALIFISCMIALALLIYYCQEKRDPRYGINENQRAITSIALSIGAPELIFKDEKKSSKLQKPIMYNKNALIFLDELSDSDTSDKIYYPPKSAAYAVARRTSMSSAQPRSISVTPHQAMEALQYFNNRRRSLGALSQTNNSTVQDANIVNKREAKKIPTFNTIHAKLSEDENEYTSSISSDVSEQNVLPMLSIENSEEVSLGKKEFLKWSKGSAKDLTMETNVQTEMPSIRKILREDLTPPKIILPKQRQRTVSLENRLPLISQTTNFAPVERLSLQSVYPPGFLPVQQGDTTLPSYKEATAGSVSTENKRTSSISSDVSEQNVLPVISKANSEEVRLGKNEPLKSPKGVSKNLSLETSVQTEIPSIRKKLSEDLTPRPSKIILGKQTSV